MKFKNKELLVQSLQFLHDCKYYPEVMDNNIYSIIEENTTL